jgi:drug/metabolite transporter (DMT)-like permease
MCLQMRGRFNNILVFFGFMLMPGVMACWAVYRYPHLVRMSAFVLATVHLVFALPLWFYLFPYICHRLGLETGIDEVMSLLVTPWIGALYLGLIVSVVGFSLALFGMVLEERKHETSSRFFAFDSKM